MKRTEIRHRLISELLQADGPVEADGLAARCGLNGRQMGPVLRTLVGEGMVVEGPFGADGATAYRWAARLAGEADDRAAAARRKLASLVESMEVLPAAKLAIDCEPVRTFHDFIINDYVPPADKRMLVFFQCSVRRPFSTSPSHGSMRRAIAVATGFDPGPERQRCPVHVVVLASRVGPVPYELEDIYPANVSSGGVKHFSNDHYERVRPVLARRMAEYMTAHARHYHRMAAFTHSRYGEVMADAAAIAGVDLPIFPDPSGVKVTVMGKSTPRTYWAKYWIQLYLEIVGWLEPAAAARAEMRLKELGVRYS